MKTLLSAVLLIAVSAWAQSPSLVGKPHTTKDGMPLCAPSYIYASNECPHYDPETKEWIGQKESAMRRWAKDHKPKFSVKPELPHHITSIAEPCDGWGCTGPVEMLPEKYIALGPGLVCAGCDDGDRHVPKPGESESHECDGTSDECWSRTRSPDKAAVPVDRGSESGINPVRYTFLSGSSIMCDGWITNDKTHPCDPAGMVVVYASDDSSVVKLDDSEYSHLQQLRASVVEEEKRLAVKYGASVPDCSRFVGSRMYFNTPHGVSTSFTCMGPGMGDVRWPTFAIDDYEYKGQFLLITKEGR